MLFYKTEEPDSLNYGYIWCPNKPDVMEGVAYGYEDFFLNDPWSYYESLEC